MLTSVSSVNFMGLIGGFSNSSLLASSYPPPGSHDIYNDIYVEGVKAGQQITVSGTHSPQPSALLRPVRRRQVEPSIEETSSESFAVPFPLRQDFGADVTPLERGLKIAIPSEWQAVLQSLNRALAILKRNLPNDYLQNFLESPSDSMLVTILTLVLEALDYGQRMWTPQLRQFLRVGAERIEDYDPSLAYRLYRSLQDITKLRHLQLKLLNDQNWEYTFLSISALLEEYSLFFNVFDRSIFSELGDDPRIITELLCSIYAQRFLQKLHGSNKIMEFTNKALVTAQYLKTLGPKYDLLLAVDANGYPSGNVAQLLNLNVSYVEYDAVKGTEPKIKMREDLQPDSVSGKRVLLLTRDVVSGSKLQSVSEWLRRLGAAQIGVFLNNPPKQGWQDIGSSEEGIYQLEMNGIQIHHPDNTDRANSLDVFWTFHESLKTPIGELRKLNRDFGQIMAQASKANPEAVEQIDAFFTEQEQFFWALNPFLPGKEKSRKRLVTRLRALVHLFEQAQTQANETDMSPLDDLITRIKNMG